VANSYTIIINEEQRSILEAALTELYPTQVAFPSDAPVFEPAMLRDLFASLRAAEAECPGATHAFNA